MASRRGGDADGIDALTCALGARYELAIFTTDWDVGALARSARREFGGPVGGRSALLGAHGESMRGRMTLHGHARSDRRHVHLHRLAIEKLRRNHELRAACLALLDEWLERPEHAASRPWLLQWREMLSSWPVQQIADVVLDPDAGQTLRQCSPLAPVLTPRERWAALEEIDRPPPSAM